MMNNANDRGMTSPATLREFDEAGLAAAPALASDELPAYRERERVSQPAFAAYFNMSRNLVSDWERGLKTSGGPSPSFGAKICKSLPHITMRASQL
jgi:putative transcriptional regulator